MKGHAVERFEKELREYFRSKYVFTVSSGKAALTLILGALNRISGREKVLIPAYTCYSVPSAVQRAGLRIALCDLVPQTLDYDFDKLAKLLKNDILCVLSTHLFGVPSDVGRIRELTKDRGIFLVEDAAQAMGVMHKGNRLGTIGDVGFYSLGRGKNISCGSGGIIVTSNDRIAQEINRMYSGVIRDSVFRHIANILATCLMSFFIHPYLFWIPKGLPFLKIGETRFYETFPINHLSGFKAGLLHDWRTKLEKYNSTREETSEYYLHSLHLRDKRTDYSGSFPFLRFPLYPNGEGSNVSICMGYGDLGISLMYPDSINNVKEIKEQFRGESYENAEMIAKTLLTLPTHVLLRDQDKQNISNVLHIAKPYFAKGGK